MTLDKAQLVEVLRSRGDHDLADRLNRELPAQVDPADYRALLSRLGLDAEAGDAQRHAGAADGHEQMPDLPTVEAERGGERG